MYQVKIFDGIEDKQGLVIHTPYINELKLSSGVVNQVLNAIDDFKFAINLRNPAWGKIRPYQTLIHVLDIKKNKKIFNGRVLRPAGSMSDGGYFAKSFECESILAYLRDSTQRHAEIHNTTVREFFEIIIANHNKQVEPHKRFKVGDVTVTNTTDNVYRYLGYEDTFATIKDKLIDRLGGYLVLREESDGNYLDYLEEVGEDINSTPIRLAHNMKSMSYEINPTEIITRLVPLGMSIESEDEGSTDASQARLTIADVNNGIDYIDDLELQKEFGIIERSITWDDVTTPQRLMTNGLNFFRDQKAAITSYSVSAANLELLGLDINSFEVGNHHPLINPVLQVFDEKIQVIEKQTDINNPQKSSLKIGDKHRTLTQYQREANRAKNDVVELKNIVNSQSKRIANIQTELTNVDNAINDINEAIESADLPALEDAIANLNQAVRSLTDAVNAIPDYGVATPYQDGLMSALDKTKLDLISIVNSINIDDLKNKLDLITVTNVIDLDDLEQRVITLENT